MIMPREELYVSGRGSVPLEPFPTALDLEAVASAAPGDPAIVIAGVAGPWLANLERQVLTLGSPMRVASKGVLHCYVEAGGFEGDITQAGTTTIVQGARLSFLASRPLHAYLQAMEGDMDASLSNDSSSAWTPADGKSFVGVLSPAEWSIEIREARAEAPVIAFAAIEAECELLVEVNLSRDSRCPTHIVNESLSRS